MRRSSRPRYSADREIAEKSPETIDRETAARWKARARAGYRRYGKTGKVDDMVIAENFRDEALEHAARGGDYGRLVGRVERELNEARREARRKVARRKSDAARRSRRGSAAPRPRGRARSR